MAKHFLLSACLVIVGAVAAAACGGNAGNGDADASPGDSMPSDVRTTDASDVADVFDAGHTPLYIPCATTHDCAAVGSSAMCLTAFPGGICTTRCTSDRTCNGGHCVQNLCVPGCTEGGAECDTYGGVCLSIDGTMPPSVCGPSCFPAGAMPPTASYPSCPATMACDVYSGACGATPMMGAENGSPCTMDSDCRGGTCILENDAMTGDPTGYIGGYCISFGYRLPDSSYNTGSPVPQGNCPPGSGPVPFSDNQVADSTQCARICAHDSDCRAGYSCQPLGMPPMVTTNGYCFPIDCSMPGMTCPSGYSCHTVMAGTNTFYNCGSNGGDPGPVDGGPTDSGPTDSGPTDSGPTDAGPVDAGPVDAGPVDAGAIDAGPVDTGSGDAAVG
jgi:hypothetical protein